MLHLITIGDPVIDTQVQIAENSNQCHVRNDSTPELCLAYGSKIPIVDSFQTLGGNAANVAVGATKLGLSAAILSTIGDDVNGGMVLDYLKRYRVSTEFITREHGADTRYSIILNYKGERTILSYSEKKNYIWPEPVPAVNWIYYTGLSEGYASICEKMLSHLHAHPNIRLGFNPGSYLLKHDSAMVKALVDRSDLLLVNLEEAETITGHSIAEVKSEAALIRELLGMGAKEVVLTDGSRGAWAGTDDSVWHMESLPVKVVSKTGAGDSFAAAYLAARHANHDIAHALEWGIANSSSVIGGHGPHAGLLDARGIEKMLTKFPDVTPVQIA